MARSPLSPRAAALAVALLLLCAAGARAAAGEGKAISDREGKQILAIFAEHRGLLRVMRRAISAVEKNKKKANGKRGLLEEGGGEEAALILKLEEDGEVVDEAEAEYK